MTGAAGWALICGIAAIAVALVPLVGDFLTIPLAVVAIFLGCLEVWRAERGRRASVVPAVFGTIFGAIALLVGLMAFVSTQSVA